MPTIETKRLLLITFTMEMMKTVLQDTKALEKLIPYHVSSEWPLEVYKKFFPYKIDRFTKYPEENEWEGIIIHKQDNLVIGDMGYKGGPNELGEVDLGYSIVPSYQNQGYASEMAIAMVQWALEQPTVTKVVACCSHDNDASIRVLEKAGLNKTIQVDDDLYWCT